MDTGVIQKDSLSPIILSPTEVRTTVSGNEWVGGKRPKNLQHADDICLLEKNTDKIKMMTVLVVAEASRCD